MTVLFELLKQSLFGWLQVVDVTFMVILIFQVRWSGKEHQEQAENQWRPERRFDAPVWGGDSQVSDLRWSMSSRFDMHTAIL